MVRIDQLPPPRGPRDATPEGISDYMEYAARVLAGEEELAPDYNDIQRRAAELAAMARPSDGPPEGSEEYRQYAVEQLTRMARNEAMIASRGRPPCELDGLENVPLDGWWGDATLDDPRIAYERFIDTCRLWVEETRKRDGREFAYFGYDPDRTTTCMWLKNFANLLRSAKCQKLMPHWYVVCCDYVVLVSSFVGVSILKEMSYI